jgi:hypothetical protein
VAALQSSGKTQRYLDLACSLVDHSKTPRLFLMHGFSGAGKSWLSSRLVSALGAVRVLSDLERKRMHGLSSAQSSHSGIQAGLYDTAATEHTYACLARYCEIGLRAGFSMIADASFLRQRQRQRFVDLARHLQVKLIILDCTAPLETLRERIRRRTTDPLNASEADLAVLEYQLSHHDALTDQEQQSVIPVAMGGATGEACDFAGLLRRIEPECAD